MISSTTKKRLVRGLAVATIAGGTIAGSFGGTPVSADPTQLTALVGVGSDTTQDVMNALAGFNFGTEYTAINAGAAANYKHFISYDASPAQNASDNCITPVLNAPAFTRPNGSGAGRKALYAANGSPAGWLGSAFTLDSGTVLPTCGTTAINLSGVVNFARSSSVNNGTGSTGTDVTYIPFGRDAVTFATYRPGGGVPLSTLTRQELIQAYDNNTLLTVADPDGTGTLTVVPCGIQTSSGTMQFFRDTVTKSNTANEAAATSVCTPTAASRLQESKGDLLKIKGDALDATLDDFVVIAGYSAAAYIAQANGVSAPNGFSDITIGSISDDSETTGGANLGSPVAGTAPNLTPNTTFYTSTAVGRNVYNVVRRSLIVNAGGTLLTNAYTALFATGTSKVCQSTQTINKFGFATIANCGEYNVTNRAWDTGVS